MIAVLIIILVIITALSVAEEVIDKPYKPYVFWSIAVILVLTAAFREMGLDHDSLNYEVNFNKYDVPATQMMVEYSFILVSSIVHLFSDNVYFLFFFYAVLGVLTKMLAIRQLSPILFLPLIIYFGNYFLLHELTQIRAGVASGLFLLSIKPLGDGRRITAFALMLGALFFHYSSAVLFPVLLFSNKSLSLKWRCALACTVPFAYCLFFMHFNIITSLSIPFISDKVELYEYMRDKGVLGDEINVFNMVFLVKVIIFLYVLYFYDIVYKHNKYAPLLLKVMSLSIVSFVVLAGLPVMAYRVSELFGVVDIIVFTLIFHTITPSFVSRIIVTLIGVILFAINLLFVGLLDPSKAPAT